MSSIANSLLIWRDITPLPQPLVRPAPNSKHVLVIGGGVIGLVTAWALLDRGYRVTIVSREWASYTKKQRIASQIAGALWEYPPAVCGQHTDKISLEHSREWCLTAYHIWDAIAADENLSRASGVRMLPSDFYFPYPIETDAFQLKKMQEMMEVGIRGFRRDPGLISKRRIDPVHGGVDAYTILAPVIDTDVAMAWIQKLVVAKGATLQTEYIRGDLVPQEQALRVRFQVDAIINCTGLAAAELAADNSCYPIRGGLLRLVNDGKSFPKINNGMTISADVDRQNEIVFLVPRSDDILIMGGFTEPHQWDLDLTLDSPVMQRMKERCERFLPELKNARLDPEYPVAQGLRPFRGTNIRVERELRKPSKASAPSRIIHSYGHGGAGWSLSFGCAGDVLGLLGEALMDLPPKARTSDSTAGKQTAVAPTVQARL